MSAMEDPESLGRMKSFQRKRLSSSSSYRSTLLSGDQGISLRSCDSEPVHSRTNFSKILPTDAIDDEEEEHCESEGGLGSRRRFRVLLGVIILVIAAAIITFSMLLAGVLHVKRSAERDGATVAGDNFVPNGPLEPQDEIFSTSGETLGNEVGEEWNGSSNETSIEVDDQFVPDEHAPQQDTILGGSNDTAQPSHDGSIFTEGAEVDFGVVDAHNNNRTSADQMLAPIGDGPAESEMASEMFRPSLMPSKSSPPTPTKTPSLGPSDVPSFKTFQGKSFGTSLGGAFGETPHETTLDTSMPPLQTSHDDYGTSGIVSNRPSSAPTSSPILNPTTAEPPPFPSSSLTAPPIESFAPPPGRPNDIFMLLTNSLQSSFLYFEPSASFLASLGYDPVWELETPGTPNHEAYRWLVDIDPMALDPLADLMKMAEVYPAIMERFVLARLFLGTGGGFWEVNADAEAAAQGKAELAEAVSKRAGEGESVVALEEPLPSRDDGGWIRYDGYLSGLPVCEWHGVECDEKGRITGLRLAGNGLSGVTPPEMCLLYKLQVLDLRANMLSGPLPLFLGHFPKLANIDLGSNMFDGSIPESFYHAGLERLDLGGNGLTGTLSADSVWEWSALKHLNLEDNSLGGTIPEEIKSCTNMEYLNLGKNFFKGPFPWSAVMGGMASLKDLWIHNNNFTGVLPEDIGAMGQQALTHFVIYGNSFSGEIPTALGDLAGLTHLYLHETDLTGTVPSELGSLSQLEVLHLQSTPLAGEMPPEVCDLLIVAALGDLRADCAPLMPDEPPRMDCECCTQCLSSVTEDL